MAILIPTKNIYRLDAPFSCDNKVLGISYEPVNNVVSEQQTVVHTDTISSTTKQSEVAGNEAFQARFIGLGVDVGNWVVAAYAAYKGHAFAQKDIVIPILGENKSIKSVETGKDSDGEPKISVSATFSVKRGMATATGSIPSSNAVNLGEIDYSFVERSEDANSIPDNLVSEQKDGNVVATATVALSRGIENVGTVTATRTVVNGVDCYVISGLTILSRVLAVKMTYNGPEMVGQTTEYPFKGEYEKYSLLNATVSINGVSVEVVQQETAPVYVGESGRKSVSINAGNDFIQKGAVECARIETKANPYVEIPDLGSASIYYGSYSVAETGNFGRLDVIVDPADEFVRMEYKFYDYFQNAGIPQASISIGDGCLVVYSDGSYAQALGKLQYSDSDDTLFVSLRTNRSDIVEFRLYGSANVQNVFSLRYAESLEKYRVGKECMTVLASISDYYDENGSLVISADGVDKKMCFDIGDEVIVMARQDGEDKPISVSAGVPNKFAVIKRNMIYDGSVLQELSLQIL